LNEVRKARFHTVYIGIGSNISPEEFILRGVKLLRQAVTLEAASSVWETPPVGGQGGNFLNAVVRVRTELTAEDLLDKILRPIEARLGRVRTSDPNSPRTIDLDILIYDQQLVDPSVWEYAHICIPLAEIYPDYTHSTTSMSLISIADRMRNISPILLRRDIYID
jgi:2-amino-4-hydroxy-6-hydroxymethyldihydropteridine diphosphokinase